MLAAEVERLSSVHGAPEWAPLLAAWAIVVSRLAGETELFIPVWGDEVQTGRKRNFDLSPSLGALGSTGEFVGQIGRAALAAVDCSWGPQTEVTNPQPPYFKVGFSWGPGPEPAGPPPYASAPWLVLTKRDGGMEAAIAYPAAWFAPATMARWADYFLTALKAMAADPDVPPAQLPIQPPSELDQQLRAWNDTAVPFPETACIQALFEAEAAQNPQAIAVIGEEGELSYGELNARANRLARHLRKLGVGPDDRVAICTERSLDLVVGMLGILKAGGAYVPLDHTYPAGRIAYILDDAQPKVLLTHAAAEPVVQEAVGQAAAPPPVVRLDRDARLWADEPETDPDPATVGLTSRHLAYVIYTSGTTGQPKGVMVEHRGLVAATLARDAYGLDEIRTFLFSSISFDSSSAPIFWALSKGGAVVLAPRDAVDRLPELGEVIARYRPTILLCTPAVYATALPSLGACDSLRAVIVGGEEPSRELMLRHRTIAPQARLFNDYGPTEATIWATFAELDPDRPVTVGHPIPNARIYLLDGRMEPVPIGAMGEIYIGGAGVARGYLNRPDLTAERFVTSPFVEGERLYRTGDRGRYLADGSLAFHGRIDLQVKIHGVRIELGEIEARLLEHPGVSEGVVAAPADAAGERRLVAYFVPSSDGPAPDAQSLRVHLSRSLPHFMTPSAYMRLDRLPLTPNGKIDRDALPSPDEQAVRIVPYEPPRREMEKVLARIWAEVLKIERVGRNDNFFESGGDSLLATQVIIAVQDALKKEITLATLYAAPTVAELARELGERVRPEVDPLGVDSVVRLHEGREAPIFMVHYLAPALARRLGRRRSVYALSYALGNEGGEGDFNHLPPSIQELAAHYIEQMRRAQPEGPYALLGHSQAGLVAYEMAQQLIAQGEEVRFLGLLDTPPPNHRQERRRLPLIETVRKVLKTPPRTFMEIVWHYTVETIRLNAVARTLTRPFWPPTWKIRFRLNQINEMRYDPQPYPGPIWIGRAVLARGSLRFGPATEAEAIWRKLAQGGVEICELAVGHLELVEDPFAATTGEAIDAAMDGAARGPASAAARPASIQPSPSRSAHLA